MRLESNSAPVARPATPVADRVRSRSRVWTPPLKQALVLTAIWRLAMAVIGVASYYIMPRGKFSPFSLIHHENWLANPLTLTVNAGVQSDAVWYARIAEQGYTYSPVHKSGIAFYPLYPLLIKLFALIVGNVWVAGMLVSTICLFLAVGVLHLWLQQRGLERLTPRVTAFMLLFPWSLFFAAMYSESLYLLLALLTFLLYERRQWYGAALAIFLLTLCRPTGIVVVPCLLVLLWQFRTRDPRAYLPPIAGMAALAAFAAYQYVMFGTFTATLRAQAVRPWYRTLHQGLLDVTLHHRPGVPSWYLAIMLLIGLIFLAAVPTVNRRIGPAYALFTALSVLMPASTGLISLERFVIVAFPVFVVSAMARMRLRLVALLTVQAWLLLLFMAGFEAGWSVW